MFNIINPSDHCKPTLIRHAFKNNYEEYELRGDISKKLSLKQYLCKITSELTELINERNNRSQNEQKAQLTLAIKFNHITDPTKTRTFYVKSQSIVMRSGDVTEDIIVKIYDSFLENYEREENILRNGSDYSFECVDLAIIQFHDVKLKRGNSYIPSPKWVTDKRATINPKNLKDNYCFS